MAKKDDNVQSLTLELLRALRGDVSALNGRFDKLELRFDGLEARVGGLESQFKDLRAEMDDRFAEMDERFDQTDSKIDTLRTDMNVGFRALFEMDERRYIDHEGRLRRIEAHLRLP